MTRKDFAKVLSTIQLVTKIFTFTAGVLVACLVVSLVYLLVTLPHETPNTIRMFTVIIMACSGIAAYWLFEARKSLEKKIKDAWDYFYRGSQWTTPSQELVTFSGEANLTGTYANFTLADGSTSRVSLASLTPVSEWVEPLSH